MLRGILAASAAALLVPAMQAPAQTGTMDQQAERVIVIDAPDVQKLSSASVPGFRTSEVIGADVYSNAGKRVGEIEDFIMSSGGYFYAVVDIEDGEFEQYVDLADDDLVVIPWDQLRASTLDQLTQQ